MGFVAGDRGGGDVGPFPVAPELDLEIGDHIRGAEAGEKMDAGELLDGTETLELEPI